MTTPTTTVPPMTCDRCPADVTHSRVEIDGLKLCAECAAKHTPAAFAPRECVVVVGNRRVCERGTAGCGWAHNDINVGAICVTVGDTTIGKVEQLREKIDAIAAVVDDDAMMGASGPDPWRTVAAVRAILAGHTPMVVAAGTYAARVKERDEARALAEAKQAQIGAMFDADGERGAEIARLRACVEADRAAFEAYAKHHEERQAWEEQIRREGAGNLPGDDEKRAHEKAKANRAHVARCDAALGAHVGAGTPITLGPNVIKDAPISTPPPPLPDAFLEAFRALEKEAGKAPSSIIPQDVMHTPLGWWFIVDVGGKEWGVSQAASPEDGARDLFRQVHGVGGGA